MTFTSEESLKTYCTQSAQHHTEDNYTSRWTQNIQTRPKKSIKARSSQQDSAAQVKKQWRVFEKFKQQRRPPKIMKQLQLSFVLCVCAWGMQTSGLQVNTEVCRNCECLSIWSRCAGTLIPASATTWDGLRTKAFSWAATAKTWASGDLKPIIWAIGRHFIIIIFHFKIIPQLLSLFHYSGECCSVKLQKCILDEETSPRHRISFRWTVWLI